MHIKVVNICPCNAMNDNQSTLKTSKSLTAGVEIKLYDHKPNSYNSRRTQGAWEFCDLPKALHKLDGRTRTKITVYCF